jgi:hypothetical protein
MKKYAIPPEGCEDYLTPGKRYEIKEINKGAFEIKADNGDYIYTCYKNSAHLKDKDWEIVKGE